jgi:hypothetical protein
MTRAWKAVGGVAVLVLVGAAVAWAVLSDGDSDETTAASSPPAPAAPEPAREQPRLEIPDRGEPIVWPRKGARVAVRSAPGGKVVKTVGWRTPFESRTVFSVVRRVGQWVAAPTPLLPTGQLGWVKLDPAKLKAGWTPYAIDVDLSSRAAQLRRGDRVLRSFTVTVGAPDSSTPTGRFAVTDIFRGNLSPVYGCCAVATTARQLNLPSGWLGGDRIAIHGTTGPLGVAASNGCVRAADEDVGALVDRVRLGSPVFIRQ